MRKGCTVINYLPPRNSNYYQCFANLTLYDTIIKTYDILILTQIFINIKSQFYHQLHREDGVGWVMGLKAIGGGALIIGGGLFVALMDVPVPWWAILIVVFAGILVISLSFLLDN